MAGQRMWIQRGDVGPGVRRWQEALLDAGYDLPKWGADGGFGEETEIATNQAQRDLKKAGFYHGKLDCKVGKLTFKALQNKIRADSPVIEPVKAPVGDIEVHDFRGKVKWPKNGRYMREWNQISSIMLHRTSVVMGESPDRYLNGNYHIAVTLGGKIVLAHPWELMIWHGNRPSPWTIGIEFEGNPEGWPGGWFWKPGGGPHGITDAQVKAGDVLLDMLVKEFKDNGSKLKYIYSHRQSTNGRAADPGHECWDKIAKPWMEKTSAVPGNDTGWKGRTWDSGLLIPNTWDDRSTFKGFW